MNEPKPAAKRTKKVATNANEEVIATEAVNEPKPAAKRTKKVAVSDEGTSGDEIVNEPKAAAKRTKKVDTVNITSEESSGDENKKGTKSSKKNKKAEILKPLELVKITDDELQEDDIEDN